MSRLHRDVMRVLIGDIVSGRLGAGAPLPREMDLAQQFRVSRGVARECLRGLEERGLIAVKHGRGATVRPEHDWDVFDSEVLLAILDSGRGAAVLSEYVECLGLIETAAAGLAAERARDEDLARLSDALTQMTAAAERADSNVAATVLYDRAESEFHHALIAATHNRALGRISEPIHRALASARRARHALRSPDPHRRVLAAIAAADPQAAIAAMQQQLVETECIHLPWGTT